MNTRTFIITGASKGVGKALDTHFAEQGHTIHALSRTTSLLDNLAAQHPDHIQPHTCDIADYTAVKNTIDTILTQSPHIDILINNAAVVQNIPFTDQPIERIDQIIDINLKGSLYVTHTLLPALIKQKSGRIINISSVAGTHGIVGQAAYCASKHGLNGFADTLAQELIQHNIHVTTLCPGGIDTPLWNPDNPYPDDIKQVIQPSEIVNLVDFLLQQPDSTLHKKLVFFPTIEWH